MKCAVLAKLALVSATATLVGSALSFAQTPAGGGTGPCEQIVQTCEKAGFVKGEAKEGKGLWVDCIKPIMQGKPAPQKSVMPLPTVDPNLVAQCKAKHPNFGEGKHK